MSILQKMLYSPIHKSPIEDIARKMDNINKEIMGSSEFTTAFPDFSRAEAMDEDTIYHVNSPGWIFKAPNKELDNSKMNGIVLSNAAYKIDVYHDAYLNKQLDESEAFTQIAKFMWKDATYKKGKGGDDIPSPPSDSEMCKIILPKSFGEDVVQSKRMTYVDYSTGSGSGGSCCQITPILPSNPDDPDAVIQSWFTVYWNKAKGVTASENPYSYSGLCDQLESGLQTETPGMYIMHCKNSSVKDKVIFVPAKCAGSHDALTEVRSSLSDCTLNMLTKKTAVTKAGKRASMSFTINWASDKFVTHLPVPMESSKMSSLIIYTYPLESAFDAEWGEVFSQWQPPISGEDANFKVYEFSSLEKIPIDVNSDKEFLSKGSLSSTYKKSAPGSVSEWLDLNKTTDSFKSF